MAIFAKKREGRFQLGDLYLIIFSLSGTMPAESQPVLKKQRTWRVFTTDQKSRLIALRKNCPEFKHSRLAQEVNDTFCGDLLSSSIGKDWLKRDAAKMPLKCRALPFPVVPKM